MARGHEEGWSGDADEWRRSLWGKDELAGEALRETIARLAGALRAEVQAYLDAHPGLPAGEHDAHIRDALVRPVVEAFNRQAGREARPRLPANAVAEVFSRLRGLGPLDRLMDDPAVTEVIVDGPGRPAYVERAGVLVDTGVTLAREEILLALERMQAGTGHPLSALNPMVEVRLPHARVTAVHERLSPGGPSLTIRLRSRTPLTSADLLRRGMLPAQLWEFLCVCLAGGANIVIAGETGSGKTTLAQALLAALPAERRIVTVEDPIELALPRPWVQQLEVAHPDLSGQGGVSARALVRLCLRLRPDHIVVGEVRDEAAWDMLDAMSVGHRGSLSTVHAGAPRGALQRLEHLSLRAGLDAPLSAVRATLVEALNLIVVVRRQVEAGTQVRRVVVAVSEVCGLEGDLYRVQDLVTWQGAALRTTGLGVSERLVARVADAGYTLPSLAALGSHASARGDTYRREDRAPW